MMLVCTRAGSESGIGIEPRTTVGQTGAYGNGINYLKGRGSLYKNSDIHKEIEALSINAIELAHTYSKIAVRSFN
jgi:hypothetical protein